MPDAGAVRTLKAVLFLGHIATGLALAEATDSDRTAAIAGTLFPDVVDKTTGWVLRIGPSGRWLAHGLPCLGLVCLAVGVIFDRRQWRGFALGYLGHLVCDLWGGGRVPWLAPFQDAKRWRRKNRWRNPKGLRAFVRLLGPEVGGAGVIWLLLHRRSGRKRLTAAGLDIFAPFREDAKAGGESSAFETS